MSITESLCMLSLFALLFYIVYLTIKEVHDLESSIHILSNELESDETPVVLVPPQDKHRQKRNKPRKRKPRKRRKTYRKEAVK